MELKITNTYDITFDNPFRVVNIPNVKIKALGIYMPDFTEIIGIDPGTTHLGIAVLTNSYKEIYEVSLQRQATAVERIKLTDNILNEILGYENLSGKIITIEGAAYGNNFRQVELAEIRAACIMSLMECNDNIYVLPPSTVRKLALGGGKTLAHNFWTELQDYPNAAAALSVAIAGKAYHDKLQLEKIK